MDLESPKESMQNQIKRIDFSKEAGYKRMYKDQEGSIYNSNKKDKIVKNKFSMKCIKTI